MHANNERRRCITAANLIDNGCKGSTIRANFQIFPNYFVLLHKNAYLCKVEPKNGLH